MNKIFKKNGDIYNSCPYINNLINNIDAITDSLSDSTKQLEFIRAINQELRDQCDPDLKDYIHDVEWELGTTTKENTMRAIKDLHDEIQELKDRIEDLTCEIKYIKEENK